MRSDNLKATDDYSAAKASMAARVTDDMKAKIAAEHYFIASAAVVALGQPLPGTPVLNAGEPVGINSPLDNLTICLLVMRNGFTIIGKSAPASPENFDEEKGRRFAYEDAIKQLWPLEGYALRERLSSAFDPDKRSARSLAVPERVTSRFRKKPVVIEACRWEGAKCGLTNGVGPMGEYPLPKGLRLSDMPLPPVSRISEVDREFDCHIVPAGEIWRAGNFLYIGAREGTHRADPGDWIIRSVKGELYSCNHDIFAATYEAA